jgi:16S rRNA (cytidine1402-2'-O)-methyltransferase
MRQAIALVSDRGTPTISDPGYRMVHDVSNNGFEIITIPGPVAAIAALSISGLPTDKFVFLGFLPRTIGKQKKILSTYCITPITFIIYESPYRLVSLLETILEVLGDIDLALAKELTKMNEKVLRGKVSDLLSELQGTTPKGEWVIVGRTKG